MLRAMPSCAICATLVACAFVNFALVATTPITVLPRLAKPRTPRPMGVFIIASVSANESFLPICSGPIFPERRPAMISPDFGSITSPNALTATMAPTITPPPMSMLAVPSPDFMASVMPNILPTDAPVPAPTFPSAGGSDTAEAAARDPIAASGRISARPRLRSYKIAEGTIGTLAAPALNPIFFSSR